MQKINPLSDDRPSASIEPESERPSETGKVTLWILLARSGGRWSCDAHYDSEEAAKRSWEAQKGCYPYFDAHRIVRVDDLPVESEGSAR